MSKVKQVGLLPAGCQPWNSDVCAARGNMFAYCATLAVYVYQYDEQYNRFNLHSIMAEHKKTIVGISWNPHNIDQFVTAGADAQLIVWNIVDQCVVSKFQNLKTIPRSLGWCPHERECIAFINTRGPLLLWNYETGSMTQNKNVQNFLSDVCLFRWHHRKMGKIAFGHADGSISMCCTGQRPQKHLVRPESLDGSDDDDPITDLQWDPLSTDYLLAANTHCGVRLIDTDSQNVIMSFKLPSAAAQVHTIAWLLTAPGMFLTGDSHSGVMRLWNVSRSTPIENIKLKKCGFRCLHVFTTTTNNNFGDSGYISSRNVNSHYTLPPGQAVCTFLDGGVGLYDLGQRKWNFLRDMGHIETIFDCKFKPDDPDQLATASFDGTLKIWNVDSMTAINTSPGNEGVIYCLSWAPADLNCIAASTSRNGAFIWDIEKGKIIRRFLEHGKSSVYSVAWNQKDSRRIATCGADSNCIIYQADGQILQKYTHPAPVFGCDWSENNKDMLATGCEDKCVRVYYMATNADQPLKTFTGHTAKVFNVKWSPLREGILCSGSDDGTIRIWDYTRDACISVLMGHTAPVRGLVWNTEVPYLLISGSWDYSIQIWDTRDGACIDTILDHGADVYGLSCHPRRPFLLASSSRDSTVRLWSLMSLVQPIEINIIAQKPWSDIIGASEYAMNQGTAPLLTGRISKTFKLQLSKHEDDTHQFKLEWFSKFFMEPGGTDNLWELVAVNNGKSDAQLSRKYSQGIMHLDHITKYKSSEAQQLEMARQRKSGMGIGGPTRDEQLRDAAKLYICLGNIQKYCEILVELGEWEKALAVAPGVSMQYWKSLAERRAKVLIEEEREELVAYCVATGDSLKLVNHFRSYGQLEEAVLSAQVAYEGSMPYPLPQIKLNSSNCNGQLDGKEQQYELIKNVIDELAERYFMSGSPIKAACCHLAVNDCKQALAKLIRANEIELAASVGLVLNDESSKPLTHLALRHLSRKCETLGKWELAVDVLKMVPDNEWDLVKLCARCAAGMVEINALHDKAGLPSMEECIVLAEKLHIKEDLWNYVKFYMLSATPELGLKVGLSHVKDQLKKDDWTANDVFDMLQLLGSIRSDRLHHHQNNTMRVELMVLCSYIGALVAIRRSYDTIVPYLFKCAKNLLQKEPSATLSMLSVDHIEHDDSVWSAIHLKSNRGITQKTKFGPEIDTLYKELLRRCGEETCALGIGPVNVSSSQFPSHSDVHISCFTGKRIQGTSFFLEDGKSAISTNDALMWSKVNPFSPLCSGERLNPF